MASLAKQLTAITALIKVLQKAEQPDTSRIFMLQLQAQQIIGAMQDKAN